MGCIRIIPETEFKTTRWSGGTTTELFIWPEGSSYAERRFLVRISTATVDIDESVFTPLPGVRRYLTPLCAGFELNVNGRESFLANGEVLEFSGSDDVACRGRGRDLNLMLKGAEGDMRVVSGAFAVKRGERAFLFAPESTAVSCCDGLKCSSARLQTLDFAEIKPGEYYSEAPLVLFRLFIDSQNI